MLKRVKVWQIEVLATLALGPGPARFHYRVTRLSEQFLDRRVETWQGRAYQYRIVNIESLHFIVRVRYQTPTKPESNQRQAIVGRYPYGL